MKHTDARRLGTHNGPHLSSMLPSSSEHATLVGLTTLAGRQHASFIRSVPVNSLKNKKSSLRQLQMRGSRSNRSCVRRALGIQPRDMEFGGMGSPKKSHGIRNETRGKRLLRQIYRTTRSRLARNANGNC